MKNVSRIPFLALSSCSTAAQKFPRGMLAVDATKKLALSAKTVNICITQQFAFPYVILTADLVVNKDRCFQQFPNSIGYHQPKLVDGDEL